MRVLHIGEYVQGGVATYIATLLNHPDNLEIEDFLICSEKISEYEWSIPVDHVSYYPYERSLLQIFPAMVAIQRKIKRVQPDVIYCHSTWAGVLARLSLFFLSKNFRVIYNAHGWAFLRDTSEWKRKVYAWVERFLLLKTDAVVDVSKYEYDAALHYGLGKEKQHIIYSGIEVDKEPIDPSIHLMKNALNLLFVGRFDPQKGVDYLLDIFNKCQRLDIHLTLIGDNVIGGLNIEKKNTNRITFLGWVPHESLCSYYATCDAVIMPSRWEAFGLVAVEAMKYGKPVIVSSRGALTEIIKDKETGYVFDFKDPNSLLNILNDLDLSVLKKMGSSAEDHFKRYFQAESMIKKTIALYKDIVS